jgi:tetratricopeptide (TPR) repeat protein
MSDQPAAERFEPQQESSAETITNISGGIGIDAQRDVNIGGDVVGRDKITEIVEGDKIAGDKIVGQEITATGRSIAIGKLNVPLVPALVALSVGLAMLVFIGLMTTLTQQQVQRLAPTPTPGKMTGDIKIAIAEFGAKNDQNEIVASSEGQEYAQKFAAGVQQNLDELKQELKAVDPGYDIAPVRGPLDVRRVEGDMPEQRRWEAQKLADQLGADIVIYGYLDIKPSLTTLTVEFFISEQFLPDAEELTGAQAFGDPRSIGADIRTNVAAKVELRKPLESEGRSFALFLIGLGKFGLERYQDAEGYFARAIEAESLGDETVKKIYYLYAGKALHDLAGTLPPEQGAQRLRLWNEAKEYYQQALKVSPNYARAQLANADIVFQTSKDNCEPDKVDVQGLQEAINGYQAALTATDKIDQATIDHKTAFYLGRAYICQSLAGIADRWSEAAQETQRVIDQGRSGANAQRESVQIRVIEAYANLGLIYWWGSAKNLLRAADQFANAIQLNAPFADSQRRLDRQALFNKQLAEIFEELPDYDKADAAWDEALRFERQWYQAAGQTLPIPSPYQQRRERYAADRIMPASEPATLTP